MIASRGRKIIAVGNEAYEMFEKAPADIRSEFAYVFWNDCQSGTAGDRTVQYDEKDRHVFWGSVPICFFRYRWI